MGTGAWIEPLCVVGHLQEERLVCLNNDYHVIVKVKLFLRIFGHLDFGYVEQSLISQCFLCSRIGPRHCAVGYEEGSRPVLSRELRKKQIRSKSIYIYIYIYNMYKEQRS